MNSSSRPRRRQFAAVAVLLGLAASAYGCQPGNPSAGAPAETHTPDRYATAPPPSMPAMSPSPSVLDDPGGDPTKNDQARTAPTREARSPQPKGKGGSPRGLQVDLASLDTGDGDAVATAFVELIHVTDTRIDATPADAGRRAAVLAYPTLAADLRAARPLSAPGAQWDELMKRHGYITADELTLGGLGAEPPDTDTTGVRAVTVTCTRHGSKSWTRSDDPKTVVVTLARPGPTADWTVRTFDYVG